MEWLLGLILVAAGASLARYMPNIWGFVLFALCAVVGVVVVVKDA